MNSNKRDSKNSKNPSQAKKTAQVIPFKKRQPENLSQASPEDLLSQFQKRFFEARFQIRQLELKIDALEKTPHPDPTILQDLRLQSEAILNRQNAWIQQLKLMLLALGTEKKN